MHPSRGTENNSLVVQFLTLVLLLAAVELTFSKTVGQNLAKKVVQKITLRRISI